MDYTKQLEAENEELRQRLAKAEWIEEYYSHLDNIDHLIPKWTIARIKNLQSGVTESTTHYFGSDKKIYGSIEERVINNINCYYSKPVTPDQDSATIDMHLHLSLEEAKKHIYDSIKQL